MFYLFEIIAITVFLIVCWRVYHRRFAAVNSAVQQSNTGEPAALVIGTRRSLHAAEGMDGGCMQVPVPERDHGASSAVLVQGELWYVAILQ